MPRIPKGLRGYRRDFINFYGNHRAIPFLELKEYLENRGYLIQVINRQENATENLPAYLDPERVYETVETIVFTKNPELMNLGPRALHPLSRVSMSNHWLAFYRNSDTPVPSKMPKRKRY